ncbi:MAG TPA: carbon storage regulator [Bacillus bacterium]|nr:carbon storage regulator [Bacillus sp. (in: firmicutes)]
MLVLSRKNGETIKIGDDIEITIVSSKNDQVKIGIKAPKNIEILRKEIYEQIQEENQQASKDISSIIMNLKK